MTIKKKDRIIRVLRLFAVVNTYHHYTMMQLYQKSSQIESNWKDAEHLSYWMSMLLPNIACSPADFLHDKNEDIDKVLDNHAEFKKWMNLVKKVGISEKTLMAFCKNVDNLQSVFQLKAFGHIFYPDWLMALFLYLNNAISKTELQNAFVEYSIFTGKPKPANIAEFRKVVLEIEKVIMEIAQKQINRNRKNE